MSCPPTLKNYFFSYGELRLSYWKSQIGNCKSQIFILQFEFLTQEVRKVKEINYQSKLLG